MTLRDDAMTLRSLMVGPRLSFTDIQLRPLIYADATIIGQVELFGLSTLTHSKLQLMVNTSETSGCDYPLPSHSHVPYNFNDVINVIQM